MNKNDRHSQLYFDNIFVVEGATCFGLRRICVPSDTG